MSDSQPRRADEPTNDSNGKSELEQLRVLLLASDREQLHELREQVEKTEVTAEEISRVLPEAIAARSQQDELLSSALAPTVENAIEVSVRRNPTVLTNSIFPVIGPAIRKSISRSMASLVEGINRTLEHSFSPRGLRWRFEAWRTGVPFGEVILKHSLVFRVEQVFLIHRESAVLLEHVTAPTVAAGDPDVISATLGAIQDFVSDSFEGGESDAISQVDFGDRLLKIARSPTAILACEVRGNPTPELGLRLQEALEAVHQAKARELREFDGEVTPFLTVRPLLEKLIVEEKAETKKSKFAPIVGALLAIAVVALLVIWFLRSSHASREWERARTALGAEPGIVLLTERREDGRLVFGGLRDPLASDPLEVLEREGVRIERVEGRWATFHSAEPELVRRRVQRALSPPASVTFELRGEELVLRGRSDHAWIQRARMAAGVLPGVESVDLDDLIDTDLQAARQLADELEQLSVPFAEGSSQLEKWRQGVAALLRKFDELEQRAFESGLELGVEVLRVTAGSSAEERQLAEDRAAAVERLLQEASSYPLRLELIRRRRFSDADSANAVRLRIHLADRRPAAEVR